MSEVCVLVPDPGSRAFRYDPADGVELVTSKITALLNTYQAPPTDIAIDENGVLTFSKYFDPTNPIVANPGDFLSGPGNGNIFCDGAVPPYSAQGYAMVPYLPAGV